MDRNRSRARAISRVGGLLTALFVAVLATPADAFTISFIDFAGANPGDLCAIEGGTTCQPRYKVSELEEGDSFDVTWFLDGSQILGPDLIEDYPTLSAEATVTLTSVSTTELVIDITLSNTTDPLAIGGEDFEAAITVFGLSVVGFTSGSLTTSGSSLDTYTAGFIAGGLPADFCASTNTGCTNGQPGQGIQIGDSDSFQFTITGNFEEDNVMLADFGTKWQTNFDDLVIPDDLDVLISGNSSFELPGTPMVPEPSTASLLALGLAGLTVAGRRRSPTR